MRAFSLSRDPEKRPNSHHCEQIRRLISAGSEVGSLQVIYAADPRVRRPESWPCRAKCLVNWACTGAAWITPRRCVACYRLRLRTSPVETMREWSRRQLSRRRPTLALEIEPAIAKSVSSLRGCMKRAQGGRSPAPTSQLRVSRKSLIET